MLQWDFEVWNEPDIDYWHASEEDYFRLYDYAVAGVRAALPGAKVGGPATTGPGSEKARKFLRDFLEHVQSGHSLATGGPIPLDFISFHAKGSPTFHDGVVTMGINHELKDVDRGLRADRFVSAVPASAGDFERGRSGGLRGVLVADESGERVSQRDAVSGVHGGGVQGAAGFAGSVQGGSDLDAELVV